MIPFTIKTRIACDNMSDIISAKYKNLHNCLAEKQINRASTIKTPEMTKTEAVIIVKHSITFCKA